MKTITCAWCGAKFEPYHPRQTFCGLPCRKLLERKYMREYMRKNLHKYKERYCAYSKLKYHLFPGHRHEYYIKRKLAGKIPPLSLKRLESMRRYSRTHSRIRYYPLDSVTYDKITEKCAIENCGFSLTVDLHHIEESPQQCAFKSRRIMPKPSSGRPQVRI